MNGQIHGKQIKDLSVGLGKFNLSGGQGDFILGTGSQLGSYEVPNSAFEYTNKEYVDSVAAGLDPKQSAKYIYNGSFSSLATSATYNAVGGTATGLGHTITFTGNLIIDSSTASVNDRIVINSSDNQGYNGIYVLTDSTTLTRSTDFDGTPSNEVDGGEFVFVTGGTTYADTGWVVSLPNQPVSDWGVTPIIFIQFSSAGVVNVGNGLVKSGNTISIDLASNSGLTFSGGDLTVDSNIAGNGLTFNSGVLNVNSNNGGIVVTSDNITLTLGSGNDSSLSIQASGLILNKTVLANNLEGNGLTSSAGVLNVVVNANALEIENDAIDLKDYIVGSREFQDDLTIYGSVELGLSASGGTALSVEGDVDITDSIYIGGTASVGGDLIVNGDLLGSAFELLAGDGLTFSSGVLDIGTSSTITVNTDNVEVRLSSLTASRFDIINPGSASQDWRLAYNGDGRFIWLNPADSDISEVIAGAGLTGGGSTGAVTLDIISSNGGIVVNPDSISLTLDPTTDNSLTIEPGGLDLNRTQLALNLVGGGLTQSGGIISTDASYILTTSGLSASLTPAGSSIQTALTALDSQTMVNFQYTGLTASGSSPVAVNGTAFSTASDGVVSVFINGLYVRTNGALYFSPDGTNSITQNIKVGDKLWVIPSQLGYDIETTDHFFVEYYTLHS